MGHNSNASLSGAAATAGTHQHGQGTTPSAADAAAIRRARFVSDSNIPSVIGMGFASSQNPNTAFSPQHQHTQSSAAAVASALGAGGVGAGEDPSAASAAAAAAAAARAFAAQPAPQLQQTQAVPQLAAFSPPSTSAYPTAINANAANAFAAATGSGAPTATPTTAPFLPATSPIYAGFSPSPFSPQAAGGFGGGMGLLAPAAAVHHHAPQPSGRTVYVGNLPADASIDELLNLVKFGPIENVKILPEKSCAFFSFLDGATAAAFHADASVKKLSLHGQELKIGWGKPSAVPTAVMMAVQQNAATRNVYVQLGQDDKTTEEELRDSLSRFGPIDQVKIVRDKNIGFVHFLSIATAMKVVAQLPHEPEWQGRRVNYGKDRCAYVPKSQQQNQAHNNQAAAMGMAAAASLGYPTAFGLSMGGPPPPSSRSASSPNHVHQHQHGHQHHLQQQQQQQHLGINGGGLNGGAFDGSLESLQQLGNRTIYLGNIHPETTTEEICNHIRGGILQTVRYIPEKHIAFVTFVDANSALAFHHLASYSGIMIHNRRLKIGWGKHSGALSPAIAMAVQAGASRNVYIGNIENPDELTEDRLREDFSEHGDVELVNSLREKNCAFVNFCSIQNAIKAIEAMKGHEQYQNVKISHGKDRCGRSMQLGNHGGNNGYRKTSGSVSPNPPRRSNGGAVGGGGGVADAAAGAANDSNDNGGSLSASSSAYDMPPIDSTKVGGGGGAGSNGGLVAAAGSGDGQ